MDYFIIWVRIRLIRKLRSYRHVRGSIVLQLQLRLLMRNIEDIEDIEEGMVAVDVEVVEETGSPDGNSSIQETRSWLVWWLCPGIP